MAEQTADKAYALRQLQIPTKVYNEAKLINVHRSSDTKESIHDTLIHLIAKGVEAENAEREAASAK